MSEFTVDIAVIGGGPAGYTAALRAASLGAKVALVEKSRLGGACLNHACIPTKTLLQSLSLLRSFNHSAQFGIASQPAAIDLDGLRRRKNSVVSLMTSGVAQTLEQNGVRVIQGSARLKSSNLVEIIKEDGTLDVLKAEKIIIATGSLPYNLHIAGIESAGVLHSEDLLELGDIPKSLAIIGAGPVGVELASIFNGLGCRVTVLEKMPQILPTEDAELTLMLGRALVKDGIVLQTGVQVEVVEAAGAVKHIRFSRGGAQDNLDVEAICVAVGQRPCFEGLALPEIGVNASNHGVEVDGHMRTRVSGIFAAGDAAGKSMLAYVAEVEGRIAAENAMGMDSAMDYTVIPRCVFTSPELASVGLTEEEARTRDPATTMLRANMAANGAATIQGERRGLVKIVAAADGRILGVHILAAGAANMLAECTLAVKQGLLVRYLARTLHLHPTLSEAVWHAALSPDF